MKKILIIFIVFIEFFSSNVFALSVSSRSACVMDTESGRILYSKDIDTPRLIASTTKIMTAIIAIESGNLDDVVTVGDEVLKMYGSSIYLSVGEQISLRDLLYGLMLRSGNDAAEVISIFIGGSEEEFVKRMNQKAIDLGMKNTVFNNPHGLDEITQNKSTAYDMALLSSYASKNKIYKEIIGTKKYETQTNLKSYIWFNRNELLNNYEYCIGGKTGYTPSAGKILVSNAEKNNMLLTTVTINDGNQYQTHKELYEYIFENYKKYLILDHNNFYIDNNFFNDKIYIKDDFYYPLTEEEKNDIKVFIKLTKIRNYKNNEAVGYVTVKLKNKEIYTDQIYVKKSNKKMNFFQKIINFIKNIF